MITPYDSPEGMAMTEKMSAGVRECQPMSAIQLEALKAAAKPKAVIWPRTCKAVRQYGSGDDGRIHFEVPVNDAFALFEAKLIDSHGCITDAGIAALTSPPEVARG